MFGMLDYRAHKLYWLLTLPINIPLRLLAMIGVPFVDYAIGVHFGSERIWQIAITLAVIFPVELVWSLFVLAISKIVNGIFNFLIDVEPTDGRTDEEAQLVVWNGEAAICSLALNNPPAEWTAEQIECVSKGDLIGRFYKGRRLKRMRALREAYLDRPDECPSEYDVKQFLKEQGMEPDLAEQIISNKTYRMWAIAYGFLLYLLAFNPLGGN